MSLKSLNVRVSTPTELIPCGRGFYQLEEESLYLPVEYPGDSARFFSYLDSSYLSFHIARDGRLIFIDLSLPRRRWPLIDNFVPPEQAAPADIRFLDFRTRFIEPSYHCDHKRENLLIRFGRGPAEHNYYLAENMIAQINSDNKLVAIWIKDIVDDLAGREILEWRNYIRRLKINPSLSSPVFCSNL